MEGSISHVAFIFTILIVLTSANQDPLFCCGYYFLAANLSSRVCENGRHLSLSCSEISSVPYDGDDDSQFTTDGERNYFKVNESDVVRLSPFCVVRTTVDGTVNEDFLVVFCRNHSIENDHNGTIVQFVENSIYIRQLLSFYHAINFMWKESNETSTSAPIPETSTSSRHLRLKFHQNIIDSLEYKKAEISMYTIACMISGVMLAVAAVLYASIPQSDDLVEKCLFNVALCQSLFFFGCASASVVLRTGFVEPHLGDYCVIFWYLFVFVELSSFTWCAVTSYHLRQTFSENMKLEGYKRMCLYTMVGYGVPALLLILCNIHAHVNSSYHEDTLELSCNAQFDLMSSFYGFLPLIVISLINISFFVSLHRQISNAKPGNVHPYTPEFSVCSFERFKFRVWVNKKIFILLILPWLVIAFLGLPMEIFRSLLVNHVLLADYLEYLIHGVYFLLCSEGILMFYALTINHNNL